MKSIFRALFSKLFFSVALSLASVAVTFFPSVGFGANRVAVFLSLGDPVVADASDVEFMRRLFHASHPHDRFVGLLAPPNASDEVTHEFFKRGLHVEIHADEEISVLMILTHGQTYLTSLGSFTSLQGIGEINETKTVGIEDIFSNLKFSREASVILNACETACGTKDQISRRAIQLANALHLESGSIYMAEDIDYSPQMMTVRGATNKIGKDLWRARHLFLPVVGVALAVVVPVEILYSKAVLPYLALSGSFATGLFAAVVSYHALATQTIKAMVLDFRNGKAFVRDEGMKADLFKKLFNSSENRSVNPRSRANSCAELFL